MFTKLKMWWFFRCLHKGMRTNPKMVELKRRMDACDAANKGD